MSGAMKLIGAAALCAGPVVEALRAAAFQGMACVVLCDGEDVVAVVAEQGDPPADLLKTAQQFVPMGAA